MINFNIDNAEVSIRKYPYNTTKINNSEFVFLNFMIKFDRIDFYIFLMLNHPKTSLCWTTI